jgi:hypothetical protein
MEVTTMKQRRFIALLAMVLVLVLCVGMLAACNKCADGHVDADKDGKCDTCGYVMPVVPEPPKPEIPPIGIETDSFNLRLLGLEPGSYSIRATVSAMSLELRESDLSEPIKYEVK